MALVAGALGIVAAAVTFLTWLDQNKDWLFPSGGAALLGTVATRLGRRRSQPRCDFCGRTNAEVGRLVVSHNGRYLCDGCVERSNEVIDEEGAGDRAASVEALCRLTVARTKASPLGARWQELQYEIDAHAHRARPSRRPRAGDVVCGATLRRIVGAGTFGAVWEAEAEDRTVAVKVFDPDKLAIGVMLWRFQRGIRAMQHLTDLDRIAPASICRIRTVAEDRLSFAMDFLSGGDLTGLHRWGWGTAKKRAVFAAVAQALAFAHDHSVVHRDVKPANIVLDAHGDAVLTDFDIADLRFAATLSVSSSALGTPHFAAPEQLLEDRDRAHPTADVFSLGKLLYYLIGECAPPLGAIRWTSGPEQDAVVNPAMREVIATCTRDDPEDRFQSVAELMRALPSSEGWISAATVA